MNSFHLEWIHSILEWIRTILERIRSRCFWNLISSPLLKIRGCLCEFIAEVIISLAFLIKKLLTFMMILEITLEWIHSNMERNHSNLITYDFRMERIHSILELIHSKIEKMIGSSHSHSTMTRRPGLMSRAGFFYSCRRLNTSEATCSFCFSKQFFFLRFDDMEVIFMSRDIFLCRIYLTL